MIPISTDLIVIGGGAAGMAAAAAAVDAGATNVIVLEKRGTLGGNAARGAGIFACESPVQKREMVDADRDLLFKTFMDWAHWKNVDPRLVRTWINKSGDTVGWLQAKGMDFVLASLYADQLRLMHIPSEGAGRQLISVLAQYCEDRGVRILRRTSAKRLVRNGRGHISGVVVKDRAGGESTLICANVVIATGGIAGNQALLEKYCPDYYPGLRVQGIGYTGDGLLMALEAGAACSETMPMLLEGPTPDSGEKLLLKFCVVDPATLWVNKNGVRFADEATGRVPFVSGNTLLRQPDRVGYVLFDERIRKHLAGMRFPARKPVSGKNRSSARPPEPLPALDTDGVLLEELRRGALHGIARIAASWTEIAEWIGASPRVLSETIEEYNSYCASGCDRDFAKDSRCLQALLEPPFFAVRTVTVLLDTLGGVKTTTRMEVVDTEGTPIPGVYAAGVLVDGFQPDTYCGELPGSAFGFAVNSGRIAGENAALRAREGRLAD